MKIAVAGKGGVGKTTIAGTLARILARSGLRVLAIDADPAMNLSFSLGIDRAVADSIIPISENDDLIEERTGVRPGSSGSIFSLTPRVADLASRFGVIGSDGVVLLVMGTVKSAGSGCLCPANSLIRALLRHAVLEIDDVVIMDMEAGIEHLGRGTARGVDFLIDVLEPSAQSIQMAEKIGELAHQLGIKNIFAVGNKVRNDSEKKFLEKSLHRHNLQLLTVVPFDPMVGESDMLGRALIDYAPQSASVRAIDALSNKLRDMWLHIQTSKKFHNIS